MTSREYFPLLPESAGPDWLDHYVEQYELPSAVNVSAWTDLLGEDPELFRKRLWMEESFALRDVEWSLKSAKHIHELCETINGNPPSTWHVINWSSAWDRSLKIKDFFELNPGSLPGRLTVIDIADTLHIVDGYHRIALLQNRCSILGNYIRENPIVKCCFGRHTS